MERHFTQIPKGSYWPGWIFEYKIMNLYKLVHITLILKKELFITITIQYVFHMLNRGKGNFKAIK